MELQANISPGNHGESPYLDWRKGQRQDAWTEANSWGFYLYLHPVTTLGVMPEFSQKQFTVDWADPNVTGIHGLGLAVQTFDAAQKTATFTIPGQPAGNTSIRFTGVTTDPNVTIYETSKKGLIGEIIDPDWLQYYQKYKVLRLMDMMETNDSPIVTFADYPAFEDPVWDRVPPEWIVELINKLPNSIIWVCFPHQFTDAAVMEMAQAIYNGVNWDNNRVRVIFEYSNEVWNPQFSQYHWVESNYPNWGATNHPRGVGLRAAQMMEIVADVFGTNSGTRWAGAICGQGGNDWQLSQMIEGIRGFNANITELFTYGSMTSYIGKTASNISDPNAQDFWAWINGRETVGEIQPTDTPDQQDYFNQALYDDLVPVIANSVNGSWARHKAICDADGLEFIAYEGGSHVVIYSPLHNSTEGQHINTALAKFHSQSAYMAQIEYDSRRAWVEQVGGKWPSVFQAVGPNNKYGSWGADEIYGQNTERMMAIDALINDTPAPDPPDPPDPPEPDPNEPLITMHIDKSLHVNVDINDDNTVIRINGTSAFQGNAFQ